LLALAFSMSLRPGCRRHHCLAFRLWVYLQTETQAAPFRKFASGGSTAQRRLPWSSSVVQIVNFLLAAYFSDNSQAFDDSAQQVALDAGSTRLRCLRVFLCKFPLLTGACSCWMCRWSVHANWPRLLHMLGFDQGNSY